MFASDEKIQKSFFLFGHSAPRGQIVPKNRTDVLPGAVQDTPRFFPLHESAHQSAA